MVHGNDLPARILRRFRRRPLPRAKPEQAGLSSERLARIGATLNADIEAGRIPGAVIAIARHGKLVMFEAYGWRDKAAGVAMTTDTIFNIASMTKPMTTVGALMLYEQGKLLIDDPLAKYFPKFASMRVAARDAAGEPTTDTVPANRPITIQDLMRHTSGLIYGGRGTTLVHKMYPAGSGDAARDYDGAAFLDKLASLPLLYQPATVWDYGFGIDVLGLTIEKISGQTLGQYLQVNLFAPIGMTDTGFSISAGPGGGSAKPLPHRSRQRQAAGAQSGIDRAAQVRLRRRLRRVDRVRLPEVRDHADEPWPLRRGPPARQQDRRLHAVRSARSEYQEYRRQCRPDPRRLRLRSWPCDTDDARRGPDARLGRTVFLGLALPAPTGGSTPGRNSPWSISRPPPARSAGTTAS